MSSNTKSKPFYCEPANAESSWTELPVWRTDGAERIQHRLLAAVLINKEMVQAFPLRYFTNRDLRWILARVRESSCDFIEFLERLSPEKLNELWGILHAVSCFWDDREIKPHEIEAMTATCRYYFNRQQAYFRAITDAANAWSGRMK